MHSVSYCALAALLTGLAPVAHAQTTFGRGALVGVNAASARYGDSTYPVQARAGGEAGLLGVVGFGHFALHPALLFSQKGFGTTLDEEHEIVDRFTTTAAYRLTYLTLPVNVAYALREDGRGFQVFAGPYVGLLVGGHDTPTTVHDPAVMTWSKGTGHLLLFPSMALLRWACKGKPASPRVFPDYARHRTLQYLLWLEQKGPKAGGISRSSAC